MRILFTCVGRRVELLQCFREAASSLNVQLEIIGLDASSTAPALAFCDKKMLSLPISDKGYIDFLVNICKEDNVDVLIPTIDTDLLILSENKELFKEAGTRVLVSASDKIAVCRDKNFTADFFESCGLKAPKTVNDYAKYDGLFPCFIKPKDGSSSINAYRADNKDELEMYAGQIGDYIIQPFIKGTEYTVDVFCDFDGNPIYITPRERLAVRSGEVIKTKITQDEAIISETMQLIEKYRPCGPLAVQLIRREETKEDYYIEINPRFGGGAPLSMMAGARSAEALLRLAGGEKLEYVSNAAEDGAVYCRFDQSVRIK